MLPERLDAPFTYAVSRLMPLRTSACSSRGPCLDPGHETVQELDPAKSRHVSLPGKNDAALVASLPAAYQGRDCHGPVVFKTLRWGDRNGRARLVRNP